MTKHFSTQRVLIIQDWVANKLQVPESKILYGSRTPEYSNARFLVWYICHEILGMSFIKLARLYSKDHTTVLHGVNKIKKTINREELIRELEREIPEMFTLPAVDYMKEFNK
jgi:chromosomal replication initiator protein